MSKHAASLHQRLVGYEVRRGDDYPLPGGVDQGHDQPLDVLLWIARIGREHLRRHSRRWFRRARLLKGRGSVPLWDLTAAIYAIEPALFRVVELSAESSAGSPYG